MKASRQCCYRCWFCMKTSRRYCGWRGPEAAGGRRLFVAFGRRRLVGTACPHSHAELEVMKYARWLPSSRRKLATTRTYSIFELRLFFIFYACLLSCGGSRSWLEKFSLSFFLVFSVSIFFLRTGVFCLLVARRVPYRCLH